MTAAPIEVVLDARGIWAKVGPFKARGLCLSVGARPVWLPLSKAFSISHKHGLDVIALADHLRRPVTVTTVGEPRPTRSPVTTTCAEPAEVTLW